MEFVLYGLIALAVVGGVGWFLTRGSGVFGVLFADDHLIELQRTVDRIQSAACETGPAISESGDDRDATKVVTSCGLTIVYTLREAGRAYEHHVSMSHREGLLAESGCRFLAACVLLRSGLPQKLSIVRSNDTLVLHVIARVPAELHRRIASAEIGPPVAVKRLREEARRLMFSLDFARIRASG